MKCLVLVCHTFLMDEGILLFKLFLPLHLSPLLNFRSIPIIRLVDPIGINLSPSLNHLWLNLDGKGWEKLFVGGIETLVEL